MIKIQYTTSLIATKDKVYISLSYFSHSYLLTLHFPIKNKVPAKSIHDLAGTFHYFRYLDTMDIYSI